MSHEHDPISVDAKYLNELFGVESGPGFLEENWPGTPRIFHHAEFSAPEIWQLPYLQSLDDALDIALPETIFANLPDRDEEYNQINVRDPMDVRKAYACKMGISMEPDLGKTTELIFWLRAIQRELGLSEQTYGRCNIYAIPDGGRTACHYDQNINFVCQISGEKTWELAPNKNIMNPTMRYTMGTPPDAPTAAFSKGKFPEHLPEEGKIRLVLKPGSVLFVPRGWWHQTSSKGESIALNFTFDQPSWAQVLAGAIAEKLMKEEAWRGVAHGLGSEGAISKKAALEFAALLAKESDLLRGISFEDLV
jgi:50S ribosomal protein L16 3-hydroxylase